MSTRSFVKSRFMGLSLAGGKTPRTHLAVVDYYAQEKKLFLSHLVRDVGEEDGYSSDTVLLDIIYELNESLKAIAIDAPLSMPKCMRCRLKCPGVEACNEPHILWMWKHHDKRSKTKRPNKIFTPYTERCVEQYISHELEQSFNFEHALGSNKAPLWARAEFLRKRLKRISLLEVFPRLNVWRIGRALKVSKTPLNFYKNSVDGEIYREAFMEKLLASEWMFIYSQDAKQMIKDAFVFEAVLSAFTAFLHHKKLTEPPPKGYPKSEAWLTFPKADFSF